MPKRNYITSLKTELKGPPEPSILRRKEVSPKIAAEESEKCRESFNYFCNAYCWVEDKEKHRMVPFKLYPCQVDLGTRLQNREWLRVLKARRLGVTRLCGAFALWRVTFFDHFTVGYANHRKDLAKDFIRHVKQIHRKLPDWLRLKPTTRRDDFLEFNQGGRGCWIWVWAAALGSADSLAADLVIIDEATLVERKQPGLLTGILHSIEPTVETGKGHIVQIAKSMGPSGEFYEGWCNGEKGRSRYENVFWSWRERPGRDQDWYDAEAAKTEGDPTFMLREYPSTPEEAWSHASGRVYPMFKRHTHVGRFRKDGTLVLDEQEAMLTPPYVPDDWLKYRAIDWGGVNPFVCLWIAVIPGLKPGLIVDPGCPETLREMLAYRYKPGSDMILKKDDHAPDCLRYCCVSYNIDGFMYVYREIYERDSAARGLLLPDLAEQIKSKSGSEVIRGTVADRSDTDSIVLMSRYLGTQIMPHTKPGGMGESGLTEIEQGVRRLQIIIAGTHSLFPKREADSLTKEILALRDAPQSPEAAMTLESWRRQKHVLKRQRARRMLLTGPSSRAMRPKRVLGGQR